MKQLLLFILLICLFSCSKNKDIDKLPRPLRDVVRHMSCDGNPMLEKFEVGANTYYKMNWNYPRPGRLPVLYNEAGIEIHPVIEINPIGPPETVWTCRP